jgi:hypothetical protein
MKKIGSIILFLFMSFLTYSQSISAYQIKNYALKAFKQRAMQSFQKGQLIDATVQSMDFFTENKDSLLALVHFAPSGFMLMSMDESVLPVLAYSLDNDLNFNDLPEGVSVFLEEYKHEIQLSKIHPNPHEAWAELKSDDDNVKLIAGVPIVAPLITSTWNQNKFYNALCPYDEASPEGYDGHVPVGCVALALGMLCNYYRYPASGTGSKTLQSPYGNFTVNFANQNYNYDCMLDVLSSYNNEVAKLIFHLGVAMDMMYAPSGSGAYSHDIPSVMTSYFKFSNSMSLEYKEHYNNNSWRNLLKTELDAARPIYYSGYGDTYGHAFLCDGYDSEDMFHFNFGWGGSGNGYFVVNSSDNSTGGFSSGQAAIINFYPASNYPQYCQPRTITAYQGTLTDGSGNRSYQNNTNCQYVIAPPNAYSMNIRVHTLKTEENHDFLRFWKGHPSKNQLVAELSGVENDYTFTTETDSLYITFTSDAQNTDEGWRLSYQVNIPSGQVCPVLKIFREWTGTFNDGSPEDISYAPNANCTWNFNPEQRDKVTAIKLFFNRFDLSPEDNLCIYDLDKYPYELLNIFNGAAPPPPSVIYRTPRIKVVFNTDNYLCKSGFDVYYECWTGGVGIEEAISSQEVIIYPNPAQEKVELSFPKELLTAAKVFITDINGKLVMYPIDIQANTKQQTIDIRHLPAGFYGIKIQTDSGKNVFTVHKKFVKF